MRKLTIRRRPVADLAPDWPPEMSALLARLYAARGLAPSDAGRTRLADLASPLAMGDVDVACALLDEVIESGGRICVVGDFDADGATGTAVAVRGLRLLGAREIGYRVPNRFRDGYGLSAGLVATLADDPPALIVTVDNGVASHAGVAAAQALGIRVLVTDHHIPGADLPGADALVNPNVSAFTTCRHGHADCDDCGELVRRNAAFPSRALAGVGVMFYLLLALRAHRRRRGVYTAAAPEPDLSCLLDLVALGTVADLVPLDANNRILVDAGLRRIRSGRACAGIQALLRVAAREAERTVAADLGFALGPRINAAGRLDDMSLGIECLLADDHACAERLAGELHAINAQRQELQSTMVEQGEALVERFLGLHVEHAAPHGIVLYEPDWHPGIVGLVATKLKERLHRPVVAFAPAAPDGRPDDPGCGDAVGELRGSARSIAGFHLRDALAEVDAAIPGMIVRFGGHAMAAGLTLRRVDLARFTDAFEAVCRRRIDAEALQSLLWSDGELSPSECSLETARQLRYAGPWGQEFAEPAFDGVFDVESWRTVGERHLKLRLRMPGQAGALDAILFNAAECTPPPARLRAVYQLDVNAWNGNEQLQLLLKHIEPV